MNEPLQQRVNDAACNQLEKSWFANEPVEIEVCLAELPDEEMAGTSEELICIEMEFLWKQWSRATATSLKSNEESVTPTFVEQYLQRFPQLDNPQHLERLVSEEISCRLQVDDRVNPAEYRQRFPKLAAESSLVRSRLDTLQQQHDTGQEDQTMVARSPSEQPDQTGYGHAEVAEGTLHGTSSDLQAKDAYIGKELGGYKILNEVGRGGMGVVYKAFDTKLKRIVALKVLRNLVHSDASELDRFLGEATAAAQMDHPNIISVFEIEKDAEAPFVVLEFASGGALNDRIDGTPFAAEKAAQLILTLAEAIHAAHEKGIVHRDLKPGNVVFTGNDEVKITDFGLAKWIDEASDLTKSGEMVGTPSYMAPEQVAGKSGVITARTDVYALGVILYELLTGRPPFTGSSTINTVLHVMEDDPVPPNKLQSEIGHDLNTICLKCLEKQPEKRYGTAAQLAADLQAYLEDRPITARRPSTVERSRKWIRRHPATSGFLAVATMVVLALIYTGFQFNRRLQAEKDMAQDNAQAAIDQREKANRARKEAETEKSEAEKARNIAEEEKKRADVARGEAESNEARALHAAYVNSISLSQQDLEASNFDGAGDRLLEIKNNPKMVQHRQLEMEMLERVNDGAYFKLVPDKPAQREALERLEVHPNQDLAVTGTKSGSITLWNLQTRKALKVVPTEKLGQITDIKWISEHAVLICDHREGAHRYHLEPGPEKQLQLVKQKTLFHGPVQAAAIHINQKKANDPSGHLALAIGDNTNPRAENKSDLVILDLQTATELQRMPGEPQIQSLAYNQDGSQLAIGTVISLVLYAQSAEGWERREIKGTDPKPRRQTPHAIESVLFLEQNDPPVVVAAGHDGKIRAWNLKTGQQEFVLAGHQSMIQSISLDPVTARLASASNDRMILVWDIDKRELLKTFDEHQREVMQVHFRPNSRQLLSVSLDGQLIVRDLDPFHPYQHDLKGTIVQRFSANSSQTHMLIVGLHQVALWNMEASPQLLKVLSDPETIYNCAIALPDDRGWLVGDRSGNIHRFVRKGDALVINGPPRKSGNTWINDLAMHPDGKRFVSVGKPHNGQQTAVELWNLENLEATRLKTFTGTLFAVTIDSSGQYVAYAGDTKAPTLRSEPSLFLYDLNSHELQSLKHHFPNAIFDLQFQPGTLALAAVGDSNIITLFQGTRWKKQTYFYGHNYYIHSVAFSANGERLISGGNGGTLRIWDVQLGNPLLVLPVPDSRSGARTLLLEKRKKIVAGYINFYSWDYATPDKPE